MGDESVAAASVLVVDDEPSMRQLLSSVLRGEGYEVGTAADGDEALSAFGSREWDLVIQDLKMPGMNGIELLKRIKEADPGALVVIITAFSSWDSAVEAMRLGAYDYIKKPFDTDVIRQIVARAVARKSAYKRMQDDLAAGKSIGKKSLEETHHFDRLSVAAGPGVFHISDMVGNSPAMQAVFDRVRRIASSDATILILGESGTGKDLVARAIHFMSLRANDPFIPVNCGSFSESLLESELFGHLEGAFTGATSDKKGLLEAADKGTFFLDEVGEMSPATQVKLLRVLETRRFIPVGGVEPRSVDVRFITATAANLEELVDQGRFREDLYYRLNVVPIEVPPLRDRRGDIPLLAGHFLALYSQRSKKNIRSISEEAMEFLASHDWPGNVRELENTIERAVALSESSVLTSDELAGKFARHGGAGAPFDQLPPDGMDLQTHLAKIESDYIRKALERCDWNMTRAAELLGMTFRQIRYKVKSLKIEKDPEGRE